MLLNKGLPKLFYYIFLAAKMLNFFISKIEYKYPMALYLFMCYITNGYLHSKIHILNIIKLNFSYF